MILRQEIWGAKPEGEKRERRWVRRVLYYGALLMLGVALGYWLRHTSAARHSMIVNLRMQTADVTIDKTFTCHADDEPCFDREMRFVSDNYPKTGDIQISSIWKDSK